MYKNWLVQHFFKNVLFKSVTSSRQTVQTGADNSWNFFSRHFLEQKKIKRQIKSVLYSVLSIMKPSKKWLSWCWSFSPWLRNESAASCVTSVTEIRKTICETGRLPNRNLTGTPRPIGRYVGSTIMSADRWNKEKTLLLCDKGFYLSGLITAWSQFYLGVPRRPTGRLF